MKRLLRHPTVRKHAAQGLKFACVGAAGAVVDFSILNLLIHVTTLDPRVANIFSTFIATVLVFLLNRSVTFRSQASGTAGEAGRFAMVYAVAYGLNVTLTAVFYTIGTHILPALSIVLLSNGSKALAIGVGIGWNYTLSHWFVFHGRKT